jgi:hypothetical protein
MAFFLFFILFGVAMYVVDWLLLSVRGRLMATSYLLTAAVVGLVSALFMHGVYGLSGMGIIVVFLIVFTGGISLMLAHGLNLYRSTLFQVFGTILLALSTGLLAWVVFKVLVAMGGIPMEEARLMKRPLIDFAVYGFLLQFGYAFSGRLAKVWLKKQSS